MQVRQMQNEVHMIKKKVGGTLFFKNINVIKDKERLMTCSRLNETKETQQLNTIPNSGLDGVLERIKKNAIKDIGSIEKLEYEGGLNKCIVSMLNLLKVLNILWFYKRISLFLGLHTEVSGRKLLDVYNLFSNGLGKKYCMCTYTYTATE